MNKAWSFAIVALLLLLAQTEAAGVIPVYIGISVLQAPPIARPGSLVQLTILITTTSPMGPVEVIVNSTKLLVLTGGRYELAGLAPGQPIRLTSVVEVPIGVGPGSYNVTVSLVSPAGGRTIRSFNYTVTVEPLDFGALVVPVVRQPLVPGQPVELPVLLFNPTPDAMKAYVDVVGGPFAQYLNASASCSSYVPPFSNSTCVIPLVVKPNASSGVYVAQANVTYVDQNDGSAVAFAKKFNVTVLPPPDFNLALLPNGAVIVGQPTILTLAVSASGAVPPTNVTIIPLNTTDIHFVFNEVKMPILTTAQIPLEAFVEHYGTVKADFEICYFVGSCTTREVTLFVPQPDVAVDVFANPPLSYPGSIVQLNIVVSANRPTGPITISVNSSYLKILEGAMAELPGLAPGAPATITAVVKVPDQTTPGDYPITMQVGDEEYTYLVHVESPSVLIQSVLIEPPVVVSESLLPYVKAIVSLVNTGVVPARDVVVQLSGVPVVGNSTVPLGVLPPGQPVQIPFLLNVTGLSPGEVELRADVRWLGGAATASAPLTVLPKADLEVNYTAANAQPGSTAIVTITLTNRGPVAAKMVSLQWTPNQIFQLHTPSSATPTANLLESNVRFLGDIAPGQSVSTTYLVDVSSDVPAGVYYATIVIEWNETGALYPVVETVTIPIRVSQTVNWLEVGPLALALLIAIVGVALIIRRRSGHSNKSQP
ncbi:NEW3 domain-containing protein [Thermoproteus tenax]|uniref:S-layer domain n=1 Tax=Thermoproteus tenax (strain ATCC 35583 / DSM 2078 / JCM 9277 / NBRC 100435 / Kra 1) TaxID=768679 RepID=G4RNZ7_THETK|nr:NEW3 domain-containing protein [Thermoproteus tenax]CCC81291.1 S-layer domain [Thermoproteus tenax Kra 1]